MGVGKAEIDRFVNVVGVEFVVLLEENMVGSGTREEFVMDAVGKLMFKAGVDDASIESSVAKTLEKLKVGSGVTTMDELKEGVPVVVEFKKGVDVAAAEVKLTGNSDDGGEVVRIVRLVIGQPVSAAILGAEEGEETLLEVRAADADDAAIDVVLLMEVMIEEFEPSVLVVLAAVAAEVVELKEVTVEVLLLTGIDDGALVLDVMVELSVESEEVLSEVKDDGPTEVVLLSEVTAAELGPTVLLELSDDAEVILSETVDDIPVEVLLLYGDTVAVSELVELEIADGVIDPAVVVMVELTMDGKAMLPDVEDEAADDNEVGADEAVELDTGNGVTAADELVEFDAAVAEAALLVAVENDVGSAV
ncbi:MAG: hypothetical protein M1812_003940 [Candelaria pacifica]|nr:MAG: hypothetical protein M1812_003940 [Candelaria pacifica]